MLVALGIILFIAGAIVAFAIDSAVEGVDLVALGYILMAGGGIALLAAVIQGAGWMSMNNRKVRSEQHVSPDGNHVVSETEQRNSL